LLTDERRIESRHERTQPSRGPSTATAAL
jgi:hypothetical protein